MRVGCLRCAGSKISATESFHSSGMVGQRGAAQLVTSGDNCNVWEGSRSYLWRSCGHICALGGRHDAQGAEDTKYISGNASISPN